MWQVFHKEMQKQGTKPECRLFFWSLCRSARYGSDFPDVFVVEILICLAFLVHGGVVHFDVFYCLKEKGAELSRLFFEEK